MSSWKKVAWRCWFFFTDDDSSRPDGDSCHHIPRGSWARQILKGCFLKRMHIQTYVQLLYMPIYLNVLDIINTYVLYMFVLHLFDIYMYTCFTSYIWKTKIYIYYVTYSCQIIHVVYYIYYIYIIYRYFLFYIHYILRIYIYICTYLHAPIYMHLSTCT